jgi:poly(hydroxyalkanoate) granule-associated protein
MIMAKVEVVVKEEPEEKERSPLLATARKMLMASIGAAALAQEEVEGLVKKMVDRGEIADKDGRTLVRDVLEKRKKQAKKAEEQMDRQIEEILHRLKVPSKGDIDALGAQITALSKKIDELVGS